MDRERLQVGSGRDVHIRKAVLRETERKLSVHTTRRTECRTCGKSGHVGAAVSEIGIVGNRHDDFVRALLQYAVRNGKLERS